MLRSPHRKLAAALLGFLPAALLAAELRLGAAPQAEGALSVADAVSRRDQLTGKTVRVRGKITEVCQMAGCWAALRDANGESTLRVKVTDGEIVFPAESVGKTAVVEGKFERFTLTRDQAIAREKHEAEEQGRKPRRTVPKTEWTVYQIAGTGAVVLD
ncbi:MAG: DUF4920 domain-containing protein [Bryobacteraceae bacterium]